jgi:hypothetical protein
MSSEFNPYIMTTFKKELGLLIDMKRTIVSLGLILLIITGLLSFLGFINYKLSYVSRIIFLILAVAFTILTLYRLYKPFTLKEAKRPFWYRALVALSYIVPLIIIAVIIYLNWLPFGYSRTFTIDVGTLDDDKGVFYVEGFGTRQMIGNEYFRGLDGVGYAVFKPIVVLKDASYIVSLKGSNVSFVSMPSIDFDWDYEFNFSEFDVIAPHTLYPQFISGKEGTADYSKPFAIVLKWRATLSGTLVKGDFVLRQDTVNMILEYGNKSISYEIPEFFLGDIQEAVLGFTGKELYLFINGEIVGSIEASGFDEIIHTGKVLEVGNVKEKIEVKDGCAYFDGETRLVLPDSSDRFEEGPFAVYLEWKPEKANDSQQLIGHYNWEIWQDINKIQFRIGRTTESNSFFNIRYNIKEDFFNKTHKLLAIYNPSDKGYIELYVNGLFIGRGHIGNNSLRKDYSRDLSLGWTPHNYGNSPYFQGTICNVKFAYTELTSENVDTINFTSSEQEIRIPIVGIGRLDSVKLEIIR